MDESIPAASVEDLVTTILMIFSASLHELHSIYLVMILFRSEFMVQQFMST